jgi:hypothetical protein
VATIDLGKETLIHSVQADFLQDQQSWIFYPDSIKVEGSVDGSHFFDIWLYEFSDARQKRPLEIRVANMSLWDLRAARYIRITARNLGDLPAWHGSKGQCWLFCDEIVVYGE